MRIAAYDIRPSAGAPQQGEPVVTALWDSEIQIDLGRALGWFVLNRLKANGGAAPQAIPLIATPHVQSRKRFGLSIPSEFIIGVDDMDQIIVRARQLAAMHPKGVGVDLLRSMTVGAFRKYLCLDDENHGQGEMDLGQLSTKSKEKFQEWRTKGDGIFWPCHVLKRIDALEKSAEEALMAFKLLFQDEIKRIAEVMLRAVSEAGVVCGLEDKSPRCRAQG